MKNTLKSKTLEMTTQDTENINWQNQFTEELSPVSLNQYESLQNLNRQLILTK